MDILQVTTPGNAADYPAFQAEGNASQFAIPFAKKVCKGEGYDIGYSNPDWMFPGAFGIDLDDPTPYHADNLPTGKVDYIFSSHCLEHVPYWHKTLDLWLSKIKPGGTLFLYLPDFSQLYWRPWSNDKHLHVLTPEIIEGFLADRGVKNLFVSGIDLNNSFMVMCEK